jgi:hypothetical protein
MISTTVGQNGMSWNASFGTSLASTGNGSGIAPSAYSTIR